MASASDNSDKECLLAVAHELDQYAADLEYVSHLRPRLQDFAGATPTLLN